MEKNLLKKIVSNPKNLERILDNLKEGIIAHDLNRQIFYFNKKAEEITKYSRDEVLGKDCHKAFSEPFCGKQCAFCGDTPLLNDKAEYFINIITKTGEKRHVEMSTVMMKGSNGENFGVLATFKDLTELINLKFKAREITGFSNIIGQTSEMLEVFQQIRDVAMYDMPVHIYGTTGTGKELVAHAIHDESPRKGAPFIPINCGALPEGLIESELFGHVKGSFSGAIRDKKGRFELADNGTIFLDEIGELPKPLQVKLLRFLQEGSVEKIGAEKTISIDVRVISATNKDLKKAIKKGKFRDDLYYRINVIPLKLPSLRNRKNDIPLLAKHFLNKTTKKNSRGLLRISGAAMSAMMDYNWPGNVRELENTIQFAIVKCKSDVICLNDLPMELTEHLSPGEKRRHPRKLGADTVRAALVKSGGNKAKAAKILGVGRATLYRFINNYPDAVPHDL